MKQQLAALLQNERVAKAIQELIDGGAVGASGAALVAEAEATDTLKSSPKHQDQHHDQRSKTANLVESPHLNFVVDAERLRACLSVDTDSHSLVKRKKT